MCYCEGDEIMYNQSHTLGMSDRRQVGATGLGSHGTKVPDRTLLLFVRLTRVDRDKLLTQIRHV